MGTLTIRLDDKLDRELARLAKQTGRTKSEVAREALRRRRQFNVIDPDTAFKESPGSGTSC